jgi:Ras-related protein Rab-11A
VRLPTLQLCTKNEELTSVVEIYRIVSSKALDSGDGAQATISAGQGISLSKPADDEASKGGKCC